MKGNQSLVHGRPLVKDTPWEYIEDMPHTDSKSICNRLNRIAGQVRGVADMVADDRYCMDILQQIQAVKSALARAETEILKRHADHCVADAIRSGNAAEQQIKFNELVELFAKVKL